MFMKCQPQRKAQTTPPTTNNPPWNPVRMPSATGIPAGMNENIATTADAPAKKICRRKCQPWTNGNGNEKYLRGYVPDTWYPLIHDSLPVFSSSCMPIYFDRVTMTAMISMTHHKHSKTIMAVAVLQPCLFARQPSLLNMTTRTYPYYCQYRKPRWRGR